MPSGNFSGCSSKGSSGVAVSVFFEAAAAFSSSAFGKVREIVVARVRVALSLQLLSYEDAVLPPYLIRLLCRLSIARPSLLLEGWLFLGSSNVDAGRALRTKEGL